MPKFDVVIKGGTVIDGLRTPRLQGGCRHRRRPRGQIGRVDASEGREVVDASHRVVAPGFVDLHTHYDSQVFWDPWCTMSGWHGVTSVVIGNCGFGFAPCEPEDRDRAMLALSRNEAVPLKTMRVGMPWDWVTYPGVPRQRRPHAQGRERHVVRAAGAALRLRGRHRQRQGHRVTDRTAGRDVPAAGRGHGGRAVVASARRSPGEVGNVQLDYDGTPMVTDCMTEREVIAFSRAMGSLGRGMAQMTGTLETAALMARESGRPIIWNALLADGALNQHGGAKYSHRDALKQLAY